MSGDSDVVAFRAAMHQPTPATRLIVALAPRFRNWRIGSDKVAMLDQAFTQKDKETLAAMTYSSNLLQSAVAKALIAELNRESKVAAPATDAVPETPWWNF